MMDLIEIINDVLTMTLSFLLVGALAFGFQSLALYAGSRGTRAEGLVGTLRQRVRFSASSKWNSSGLATPVQYIITTVTPALVAFLVVIVGGVFGFIMGGVVLLLSMGLCYWFAL